MIVKFIKYMLRKNNSIGFYEIHEFCEATCLIDNGYLTVKNTADN